MASKIRRVCAILCLLAVPASAQRTPQDSAGAETSYIVGAHDVLTITCYDQADLSGKFAVEDDGTFTFPLVGRFTAGGLTLHAIEDGLKGALRDGGYFKNPQLSVAVEQYRSQKVFIVGEVRSPGSYPLSGDMTLVEALARAGSALPTASGEAIIVHAAAGQRAVGPTLPSQRNASNITHVDLRALQSGLLANNAALRDGDTIFIPRAESIYVFGQVRNPGAYALQERNTTVLQVLSLAGGVSDRGSMSRIRIIRIVGGNKKEFRVSLTDPVQAGDTVIVPERYL